MFGVKMGMPTFSVHFLCAFLVDIRIDSRQTPHGLRLTSSLLKDRKKGRIMFPQGYEPKSSDPARFRENPITLGRQTRRPRYGIFLFATS